MLLECNRDEAVRRPLPPPDSLCPPQKRKIHDTGYEISAGQDMRTYPS